MQNKKDANQKYVNKHGGSNLDVSPNTISKAIRKVFTAVHKTLNFKPQITQNKKDVNWKYINKQGGSNLDVHVYIRQNNISRYAMKATRKT